MATGYRQVINYTVKELDSLLEHLEVRGWWCRIRPDEQRGNTILLRLLKNNLTDPKRCRELIGNEY